MKRADQYAAIDRALAILATTGILPQHLDCLAVFARAVLPPGDVADYPREVRNAYLPSTDDLMHHETRHGVRDLDRRPFTRPAAPANPGVATFSNPPSPTTTTDDK